MAPSRDRTTWLHGDLFQCLRPPVAASRAWRLVLLGAPGVGKGTQAELLSGVLGACPLSTGDLFRAACEQSFAPGSEMAEAQARTVRGELVPDDVVLAVMKNRRGCLRCAGGFLLDGFPRTIVQAAALDGLVAAERRHLDAAVCYELPFPELVARMTGRRVCPLCHALYHVEKRLPRRAGVCDRCGGTLVQRADDQPAPVHARLRAYVEATAQVANYYERQGILVTVDASGSPEQVLQRTLGALKVPMPSPENRQPAEASRPRNAHD